MTSKKICIITGEASGDIHGSKLAEAFKTADPNILICGSGGKRMKPWVNAGFVESTHLNATGITEILGLLPAYLRLFRDILNMIHQERPDCVVFVDNPGLNLRIAARLCKTKLPLYYYICPQVWAWHSERVHKLKAWFRSLYVIFEFEKKFLSDHQTESMFVGHPLATQLKPFLDQIRPRPLNKNIQKILLLPGSRTHEIKRLLPDMLAAVALLDQSGVNVDISILEIETVPQALYDRLLQSFPKIHRLKQSQKHQAFLDSDMAICCSGTVTLECAMLGLPMIIINKSSWLTVQIARRVIKIQYVGLPNLLSSEQVCTELLQESCTGENIYEEVQKLLKDPNRVRKQSETLTRLTQPLTHHNAPKLTAEDILRQL